MRVLVLRQNYPPERGALRHTREWATALVRRGHQVTVVTGLPHYPIGRPYPGFSALRPDVRDEDGVRVIRTPLVMGSNRQPLRRILGFCTFPLLALPWILRAERPDVVVGSVPPVPVALLALATARFHRAPLVLTVHDLVPYTTLEPRGLHRWPLADALVRSCVGLYDRAQRIVALHPAQVDQLVHYGATRERIRVLTHAVDFPRFDTLSAADIPFRLPRTHGRRVVLYVGTLAVYHEVHTLVRAFRDDAVRRLPVDLAIVGDGECRDELARLAAEPPAAAVHVLPSVPPDWVPAVMAQADALAIANPPDSPYTGSKMCEYLATARPILARRSVGTARILTDADCGWIIDPDRPQTLVDALTTLLVHPERARELGLNGRRYAARHFDAARLHEAWEQLLLDAAGQA